MSRASTLFFVKLSLLAVGLAVAGASLAPVVSAALGKMAPLHVWWFAMLACGLCAAAAAAGTRWFWPAVLAATLLIGTSSQFGLMRIEVFEFINIRPKTNYSYLMFLGIVFQAAVTGAMVLRQGMISGTLRRVSALGPAKAALLAVLILGFSVTVMRYVAIKDPVAYGIQIVLAGGFLALNFANLCAMAASVSAEPLGDLVARVSDRISLPGAAESVRPYDRRLPYAVALWTLVVTCLLCLFAFERIPHVIDEALYLFQSKYFVQGRISVPAPPVSKAFLIFLVDFVDGRWYSIMPPGWPLVLAIGTALNVPWLVNPILAAACILLAHGVFCRVSGRGTANLIIVLIAVSPWFLAMSASLMSHTLTLAAMLAAWWLLLKARDDGWFWGAVLAGASMGIVFLTRFLDGLIVGVLTGLWTLSFLTDRSRWRVVLGYSLGCIVVGGLIFPYNDQLTGDPLLTTLTKFFDDLWHPGADRMGFGPDIGPGPESAWVAELYPGHSPLEGLIHSQHNLQVVNRELFGWGIGSLAFVFIHALWGRWSRTDWYMAAIIVAVIGALSMFWFSGGFYIGVRYWFIAFLPFVVLTASGIRTLAARLSHIDGSVLAVQRLGFAVAVLCLFSAGSFMTWRAAAKYYGYRHFHTDYREMAKRPELAGSLIIVKATSSDDYVSAFLNNTPDLSGPGPLFARDLGRASNRALVAAFPDRPIYFVEGRSRTGRKAYIARGPVPASAVR